MAYPECNNPEQSPIDLAYANEMGNSEISIEFSRYYEDYSDAPMTKSGGGVSVLLGTDGAPFGDGTMELTRVDEISDWHPVQLHFHSPSEHTIDGKHMDLEMHIVHLTTEMELGAVFAVFFDENEGGDGENTFLNQLDGLKNQDSITGPLSLKGYLQSLNTEDFWSYDGSLTTPPCTEGVRWSVLKSIQPISRYQLRMFSNVWKDNESW